MEKENQVLDLNKMVTEVMTEKFNDGTLKQLISDHVDKAISEALRNNICGYNASFTKELDEKMKPILSTALARSNMTGLIDKLTLMINELAANTELSQVSKVHESLSKYFGATKKLPEAYGPIKMSEIFEKYKEFVRDHIDEYSIDMDNVDFDDCDNPARADVKIDVVLEYDDLANQHYEEKERRYGTSYTTKTFYVMKARFNNEYEQSGDFNYDIGFAVKQYSAFRSDDYYYLEVDFKDLRLADLPYIDEFLLYLYHLQERHIKIIVDKKYIDDEIIYTVEKE